MDNINLVKLVCGGFDRVSSSQFLILSQLQRAALNTKEVKRDSKVIIMLV